MFWNYEYCNTRSSDYDVLVQSEDTKLSDLIFEEDILQEIKTSNPNLTNYLIKPENLINLVDNITRLTEEMCCDKLVYSHLHAAYISCEILTACSTEIFDALLQHPDSVNKIISSLSRDPLDKAPKLSPKAVRVAPQKATLISKLISNIHSQAPADLSCHITKNLDIFSELVNVLVHNIDVSGSFEILSTFINRTNPSELRYVFCEILSKLNFVYNLIDVLSLSNIEDKQRNACQLLCDIIVIGRQEASEQANDAPTAQDMLAELLESREAVNLILKQIFPRNKTDNRVDIKNSTNTNTSSSTNTTSTTNIDTNTNTTTNTATNTNTNTDTKPDNDTDTDADTESKTETAADTNLNTNNDTKLNHDMGTDTNTHTNIGTDTSTKTKTNTDADINTNTDNNATTDTNTNTDTDTNTNTNTNPNTEINTNTDSDNKIGVKTDRTDILIDNHTENHTHSQTDIQNDTQTVAQNSVQTDVPTDTKTDTPTDNHIGNHISTDKDTDEATNATYENKKDDSINEAKPNTTAIVCGMKVLQTLVEQKTNINNNNNNPGQQTTNYLARTIERIQDEIAASLINFHELLLNPPKQEPIKTTFGVIQKPLGYLRLEVVNLVRALLSTNSPVIIRELVKLNTMKVIIDLFVEYSWNNLLHTQVEQALCLIIKNCRHDDDLKFQFDMQKHTKNNIENHHEHETLSENNNEKVSTPDEIPSRALLSQLLNECDLIGRLLLPSRNGEQANFGHIIQMINSIAINCDLDTIQDHLNEMKEKRPELYDRWTTFVNVDVASFKENSSYFDLHTINNHIDDRDKLRNQLTTHSQQHHFITSSQNHHNQQHHPSNPSSNNENDVKNLNGHGEDNQFLAYLSFTRETVIPSINVDVLPKSRRSTTKNNNL